MVLRLKSVSVARQDLVLSPQDIIERYLYGLPLFEERGNLYRVLEERILAHQQEMENLIAQKLRRQIIQEEQDFIREEWLQWGAIRVSYKVVKVFSLQGVLGIYNQITYPPEWISTRNTTDRREGGSNQIFVVPNVGASTPLGGAVVYSGITPHLNFFGNTRIPNYWRVTYATGFERVPADILDAIGMASAIHILAILGDITMQPGVTSTSVGFDGFSQSISLARSGKDSLYGSRISLYGEQLQNKMQEIKRNYRGIMLSNA